MASFKFCKTLYLLLVSWALPAFVSAAPTVEGIFTRGIDIVKLVIQFLWVLAFAVFLWGIVKFIAAAGSQEKRKEAKNLIVYGLIGLFILLSFMGIIAILQNTIFGEGGSSGGGAPYDPFEGLFGPI